MLTYFRYTFSEYEIEEILSNSSDVLNKIKFKANDNKEYELVIKGNGYSLAYNENQTKLYPYEDGLYLHSVAKIRVDKDHYIYILLDSEIDSPIRKDIHIDRLLYITSRPISAEYIELLANTTNFNNDNDFILLCFMYFVFRLNNESTIDLNIYLEDKLSYYGYTDSDFCDNVPFNNSTNINYLEIVNLFLESLYNYPVFKTVNLDEYSLDMMDLQSMYLQYFNSIVLSKRS